MNHSCHPGWGVACQYLNGAVYDKRIAGGCKAVKQDQQIYIFRAGHRMRQVEGMLFLWLHWLEGCSHVYYMWPVLHEHEIHLFLTNIPDAQMKQSRNDETEFRMT